MELLHVRHATSILTYAGIRILIDPVFSDKDSFPAIPLTPNRRRNPLVDLSTPISTLLEIDLILVTHIHQDHFDGKAKELLNKNLPLICQCQNEQKINSEGFLNVHPVKGSIKHKSITITKVRAKHGIGTTGKAMGTTSGYILEAETEPTVYLTGDTIYTNEMKAKIENFKPQVLIMNAGSPKFLYSDRIVMNIMDIEKTLKVNPNLTFVVVHLDTFNHCIETRDDIKDYFTPNKLQDLGVKNFYVPDDNQLLDTITFANCK